VGDRTAGRLTAGHRSRRLLGGRQHAVSSVVDHVGGRSRCCSPRCRGRRRRTGLWCRRGDPRRLGPRRDRGRIARGGERSRLHQRRRSKRRRREDQRRGPRQRYAGPGHPPHGRRTRRWRHGHQRCDLGDPSLGSSGPRLGDRLPCVGPFRDPGGHTFGAGRDRGGDVWSQAQAGNDGEARKAVGEGLHRRSLWRE